MNEIYYKITTNTDNIYSYIEQMLSDMSSLLQYINKFNHKKVFVLGYYNITGDNQDIFNYANYKLKQIVMNEGFEYIDLAKTFNNNPLFFQNTTNFIPNNLGYQKISQIIIEKIKNY